MKDDATVGGTGLAPDGIPVCVFQQVSWLSDRTCSTSSTSLMEAGSCPARRFWRSCSRTTGTTASTSPHPAKVRRVVSFSHVMSCIHCRSTERRTCKEEKNCLSSDECFLMSGFSLCPMAFFVFRQAIPLSVGVSPPTLFHAEHRVANTTLIQHDFRWELYYIIVTAVFLSASQWAYSRTSWGGQVPRHPPFIRASFTAHVECLCEEVSEQVVCASASKLRPWSCSTTW